MSAEQRRRLALVLWTGYVMLVVLSPLAIGRFVLNPGFTTSDVFDVESLLLGQVTIVPFAIVGALITIRRPFSRLGWLMLVIVLLQASGYIFEAYDQHFAAVSGTPLAGWLVWCNQWVSQPQFMLLFSVLPLIFPTGRLHSARWRPLAWLGFGGMLLVSISVAFGESVADDPRMPSLVRSAGLATWADRLLVPGFIISIIAAVGAIVSLVVRFRRARGVERQQIKWFAFAGSIIVVALVVSILSLLAPTLVPAFVANAMWVVALLGALVGLPVAMGIAVLRYRLLDIDVVINRALVYGTLTALTAINYAVWVVGLERLLRPVTGSSDLAIAGATLAVAALVRPARRRVQFLVDRRFYRHKYDAATTIERFSSRLRDEIDLNTLTAELYAVVTETMQPAHVSVWLRPWSDSAVTRHE